MCRLSIAVAAVCLSAGVPVRAQTVLTFDEAIARAREQAGAVLVARARIPEAESGVLAASARFRDNPIVEASAGPRSGRGDRSTDFAIGASQAFETGGQRRARIAVAEAVVDQQRAAVDEARRAVVLDAAMAFLDGVAARERLGLAEQADAVSRELLTATERRFALGDIAAIDVNLARIEAARAAAALRSARADFTAAIGRLRVLLRLPAQDAVQLTGSFEMAPLQSLDSLRGVLDQRPDFAALRAEMREADAEIQLGRAQERPDLGFRVGYEREEANDIVLGGVTVALPLFQRGASTRAGGVARASRARVELEAARFTAVTELETAYAVHQQHAALSAVLVAEAVPSVTDNEDLARRSYEAGELGLLDLLLIRRDSLDTRTMVIERRLDAARSRVMVDHVAGVLR